MSSPVREWFSAQELADLNLPGLATTKRGVQKVIAREGWTKSRPRAGRGGGVEYHITMLPEAAKARLMAGPAQRTERLDREAAWARWDQLPAGLKAEARRRMDVIGQVEALISHGMRKAAAVEEVVRQAQREANREGGKAGVSCSTIFGWYQRIAGVPAEDRAAYLAPDYQGRTAKEEIHPEAWDLYKGDYLRLSQPTHAHCYRNLLRLADDRGWKLPSIVTFKRRLDAEIPPAVQTYCRDGERALSHAFPHLDRDRSSIAPMQILNLDGHTWDLRVQWGEHVVRVHSLVVQDIASGRILAIRHDFTLNHHLVRLALGDAFREFGVCDTLLMDNGRENAAGAISGGQHRLRWGRTPEEEPAGLLKILGVKAVFAKPYWGQAKPIERSFRNFAHDIAKRAEFEGAYTGHNPVSKPENYGDRAIPYAEFDAIVRREIAFYNAQPGRRGIGMNGRSFDQVFEEGLQRRPIKRLTETQLRLCMLASKLVPMHRKTGEVKVEGHRYWSPELGDIPRQAVMVRFDPERMDLPASIYSKDGKLLAEAERVGAGNFDNLADARNQSKNVRAYAKATKDQAAALRRLKAQDVAAQLASPAPPEPVEADEKVVALVPRAPRRADQVGRASGPSQEFEDAFDRGAAALMGLG